MSAPPAAPVEPPVEVPAEPVVGSEVPAAAVAELEASLAETRAELSTANEAVGSLERELATSRAELAVLQERYAALEGDLANAVDEILHTKSTAQGEQNRAFATSRISEVRVQLEGFAANDDPDVVARIDRAGEFLLRADQALREENYGGAAYLADRAGELVRQAGVVAEMRTRHQGLIPIVPPRRFEVLVNANLRQGPGLDRERVGSAAAGSFVEADGRDGDWYRVRTEGGQVAWIYRELLQ